MDDCTEFYTPVATSTVWKKGRSDSWTNEQDTTFQQLTDLTDIQSPSNKENVDTENTSAHENEYRCKSMGESTMNLGKYLIPSYPGEMEEDSFLSHEMKAYQGDNLEETVRSSRSSLNAPPPPSIYVTEAPASDASGDLKHDSVTNHSSNSVGTDRNCENQEVADTFPLDDVYSGEENLLDDSFSKYFEQAPDISAENADIEHKSLAQELDESQSPVHVRSNRRKSEGSLNTVSYIDPEKSMTTETLDNSLQLSEEGSTSTLHDKSAGEQSTTEIQESIADLSLKQNNLNHVSSRENISDLPESISLVDLTTDENNLNDDPGLPLEESNLNLVSVGEHHDIYHESLVDLTADEEPNTAEENDLNHDTVADSTIEELYTSADEQVQPSDDPQKLLPEEKNLFEHKWEHPSFNATVLPTKSNTPYHDTLSFQDVHVTKKIQFPPSHTVEVPCPLGMSHSIVLSIQNETDLWLRCDISFDYEGKQNGFTSSKKQIISPLGDEEVQVWLSPVRKGLCIGTLTIDIVSVISGMMPHQQRTCKITAIGEMPAISFSPENIPFGIQDDTIQASFEIHNSSKYEVPLKVVLDADGIDDAFSLADPITKYPTSLIRVSLQPNQTYFGHIEFVPYDKYSDCKGVLRVYVDSPNGMLLSQCEVTGTVALYKVHSKHNIVFHCSPGAPVSKQVPFRNTGNVVTAVDLSVAPPFDVSPSYIPSLVPGEDALCEVTYFPAVVERVSGFLNLSLGESGFVFQVPIEGRSDNLIKAGPAAAGTAQSTESLLQSNKSVINFGGNEIGRQTQQTLLLKNDSDTQLMCLVLRVASESQAFYILNDNISLCCDVILAAGASQSVNIGYTPLHVQQHTGQLWIRSKDTTASFCIPLTGHGGLSQVSVLHAQQSSSQLWVEMGDIVPNTRNTKRITLHNTGPRPAFVSGALETSAGHPLPPSLGWINPKSFVIQEKSSRDVFIIFEPTDRDMNFNNRVASLKLYCGDEIARQRFCKVLASTESPIAVDLAFDPCSEFLVAGDVGDCEVEVPGGKCDVEAERHLFVGGLYQLFISILGQPRRRESLVPIQDKPREIKQPATQMTAPQITVRRNSDMKKKPELKNKCVLKWGLSADQVEMKTNTATFGIVNTSHTALVYDISSEAHLYSITPQAGSIPADDSAVISITTLTNKPFLSTLLVSAAGQERSLKLTYAPEVVRERSAEHIPEKSVVFESIPVNTSKVAFYDFKNTYDAKLKWKLCSIAPAYVRVGNEDPRRVKYSAFCVGIVGGVTPRFTHERIPITFYPKSPGQFTQCWTFSYNVMALTNSQITHKRRVILEGRSTDCTPALPPKLPPAPSQNSAPKRPSSSVSRASSSYSSCPKSANKVFLRTEKVEFYCKPMEQQSVSFKLGNPLKVGSNVKLGALTAPFHLKYCEVLVEAGHSARIPIRFKPEQAGMYTQALKIITEHDVFYLPVLGVSEV